MVSVVAKIDEETLGALDKLCAGKSRSEIIRKALRQYVARHKLEERKQKVLEYMKDSSESEAMRQLAESGIDEAAELLQRAETE